jgi:hypothetical protein
MNRNEHYDKGEELLVEANQCLKIAAESIDLDHTIFHHERATALATLAQAHFAAVRAYESLPMRTEKNRAEEQSDGTR